MSSEPDVLAPVSAPDVILLDPDWHSRTMLRAQLIEDGLDVLASDRWSTMRRWFRVGWKPKLAIVDLKDLPDPEQTLADLCAVMGVGRVLVLTGAGTISPRAIERLGCVALQRPVTVGRIAAIAAQLAGPD